MGIKKNRRVQSQPVFFDLYAESFSAAQISLFHVIVLTELLSGAG
jgi:hypothetical protein